MTSTIWESYKIMPDLKSFAMQKESISNNAIITNYNDGRIITSSDLRQLDQLYNDNQEYIIILMKRKHNNSQMPEWFKTGNDEVYEKKQPQWFKTWTEEVYEKKQPQGFKAWTEEVYEKKQPQWFEKGNKDVFEPRMSGLEKRIDAIVKANNLVDPTAQK